MSFDFHAPRLRRMENVAGGTGQLTYYMGHDRSDRLVRAVRNGYLICYGTVKRQSNPPRVGAA